MPVNAEFILAAPLTGLGTRDTTRNMVKIIVSSQRIVRVYVARIGELR